MSCIFNKYVRLFYNSETDIISFQPCCHLPHNRGEVDELTLDKIPYQEFLKLDNVMEYLNKIHKNFPYIMPTESKSGNCTPPCDYMNYSVESISINSLEACNLHCRMCRKNVISASEKDKEVYFNLLYKIKGLGLNIIELTTAGEPFLFKKETFEYLESLSLKDCKQVYIITNATLLTKEDIDRLSKIKETSGVSICIQVSLDSIDESTYKIIRQNNNFQNVMDNIYYLNEKGLLAEVSFTIQSLNVWQLPLLDKFWAEKGIKFNVHLAAPKAELSKREMELVKNSQSWKNFSKSHSIC